MPDNGPGADVAAATVRSPGNEFKKVLYSVGDRIATITLNDPDKRNALSNELLDDLLAAFRRAREDDSVGSVVLTGAGKVFCAGGDLSGFSAELPLVHKHRGTDRFVELFRLITELGKPTVCAANGHVLAGGLGVALACDLVIAKDTAQFGTPEINVGLFPFMIMAVIYRNVPRKKTNELLLLGERLTAGEAVTHGLINKAVPEAEFDAAVADWAAKLAAKAPVVMRLGRDAMYRQQDMPFIEALEFLHSQLTISFATEDVIEGATAFFEKRDPVWKGR